jgi:small subunit ribosomal protein S25e
MGGGKKKQSIKQMTKPKKTKEKKQKTKPSLLSATKKPLGLTLPNINDKKIIGELKGLKVFTPSVIASRFNIRLSLANSFLKELEKRKIIEYVSGGKNLKIYKRVQKASL